MANFEQRRRKKLEKRRRKRAQSEKPRESGCTRPAFATVRDCSNPEFRSLSTRALKKRKARILKSVRRN